MNLLVPVDFSPCSQNALHYSIALAREINAKLYVLHSYRLTKPFGRVSPGTSLSIRDELEADTQTKFDSLKTTIGNNPGVEIEYIVDIGFASDTITSNAQEYGIDLIIMGTKGNGMIHQVFGSTTLNVIKHSDCPVLTVPSNVSYSGMSEIAIASDYAHRHEIKTFKTLKDLSQNLNSHLHVLTLNSSIRVTDDEIESGEMKLNKFFPEHDLHYHFKSANGIEKGLNSLVEQLKADVLVLIPRNREVFGKMFGKSVTKNLILHSSLPIMALPA